jgi:hypothetical protein
MLNWLFGTGRQLKTLGNIKWIDRETERFFTADLEGLKNETQGIVKMASEAKKREQLATQYFQGLATIEQAKLSAQGNGYQALAQVNQSRSRLRSLKSKLLEASRG